MRKINELLFQQFKLFIKIKLLLLGVIGIIGLIIGFSFYYSSIGVDTLLYMQQIGNYSFYICAVYTIICFMFLTYDKKNDLDEVLDVTNNKHKYYSIIILFILLVCISIVMLLMILYIAFNNHSISQLFSIYIPSFFLNIFFPLCICLLVSSLLSYYLSYNKAGIFLILFLLIISPLFYIDLGDNIFNIFLRPFQFLYQADDFSMDYMYGLKDELYRWFIVFAYGIIFLGVCIMQRYKGKKKTIVLIITLCIAGGSIVYSARPQSRLNTQQSKSELMRQVRGAYQEPYNSYQPVDYHFGNFNFDIELKEKLYVEGTMLLTSKKKRTDFTFTLYSGYDIQKLISHQELNYDRKNNLVHITFKQPIQEAKLEIEYSGYHPTFYSNEQAVALPGYFLWYPMSGEHQVAFVVDDKNNQINGEYGYNSFNKIETTQMNLNIKANYPVITNITEQSPYHYSGQADSITLFGGQIEKGDHVIMNVFPTYYGKLYTKEEGLKTLNEYYNESLKQLSDYKMSSLLENKKVINQPKSLTYFSDLNTLAIFDNYIIAKDGIITSEQIIASQMFDMSTHSKIVYCLKSSLILKDMQQAKDDFLQFYQMAQSQTPEGIESIKHLKQLLDKMKAEEFIKEFYDYGLGYTNYQNDEIFLEAMEVKYDRN